MLSVEGNKTKLRSRGGKKFTESLKYEQNQVGSVAEIKVSEPCAEYQSPKIVKVQNSMATSPGAPPSFFKITPSSRKINPTM